MLCPQVPTWERDQGDLLHMGRGDIRLLDIFDQTLANMLLVLFVLARHVLTCHPHRHSSSWHQKSDEVVSCSTTCKWKTIPCERAYAWLLHLLTWCSISFQPSCSNLAKHRRHLSWYQKVCHVVDDAGCFDDVRWWWWLWSMFLSWCTFNGKSDGSRVVVFEMLNELDRKDWK